jgi:TnsA endonuclease N terminal
MFKPKNPAKYKGDPTQIVYRSSWELSMMASFDTDKKVKCWSSEEVVIPYTSPVDNRFHRYFVDFFVEYTDGRKKLIEVKPHAQRQPPKRRPNQTERTFVNEVKTYAVNQAKWESAKRFCDKRGWEFQILTEKEMKGVFL